jgi:hypothetical protein
MSSCCGGGGGGGEGKGKIGRKGERKKLVKDKASLLYASVNNARI